MPMMRLLAVILSLSCCLLQGAFAKARLRSGNLEQTGVEMSAGSWNLESQAVDSTQILSPAEMEEEEEDTQEVPAVQPEAFDAALSGAGMALSSVPKVAALMSRTPSAPMRVPLPALHEPRANQKIALISEPPRVPPLLQSFGISDPAPKAPAVVREVADKAAEKARSGHVVSPPLTNVSKGETHLVASPKDPNLFENSAHKECNPPCKGNRGVCNDMVCFCKTPYTGTTCQNEILAGSWRFGPALTIGATVMCILLGILASTIFYSFIRENVEQRMATIGEEKVNKESWTPSDTGSKKKRAR